MIKFKRSKNTTKTVLAEDSKQTAAFRNLFRWVPAIPTGWKSFTEARQLEHNGKTFLLVVNPETKDYVINVINWEYCEAKYSNKEALLA